jgi:8-oxo-dGTP pyrophosphatase MutT (NUDIX family)
MIEVACGIMMNKEKKILVGLRPEGKPNAGYWEFPGGKKEDNENIIECLKREWLEELNLNIDINNEIYSYKCENYFCRFFLGNITNEEDLKMNIHKEICYYDKNDIYNLKLFEGDYKILDKIII